MPQTLLSNHNHLYTLARSPGLRLPAGLSDSARKWIDRLYPLLAIVFALATPFVASFLALIPILIIMAIANSSVPLTGSTDLQLLALLLSSFIPIYFMVWIWALLLEKRHLWTMGLEKAGVVGKYLKGMVAGLLLFSAAVGLLALFGDVRLVDRLEPLGTAGVLGILLLLFGWIAQGGAEELLARGYLLPVVGSRYGTLVGVIVSSLVFATWHLLNPNLSLLAVLNLFLYGIFAAFYALNEGGLWGVCAFHTVWNWVQGNFYGFEVSGAAFGGSSLLRLQESGPDWFTGGNFGPEGGLAVTLVLLVGCLWLFWASLRQRNRTNHLLNPDQNLPEN